MVEDHQRFKDEADWDYEGDAMKRATVNTSMPCAASFVLLIFLLATTGCTITETVSDILSSTTPGDWYDENGLPRAERKVDVFVAINLENVKADLARGHGEYLAAVGTLLQVPAEREHEFMLLAQQEYAAVAERERDVVTHRLREVSNHLRLLN